MAGERSAPAGAELPELEAGGLAALVAGPGRAALEALLPRYLAGCRWFGGKARAVERTRLLDAPAVPVGPREARLALVEVHYEDGGAETYTLPLLVADGARAARVRAEHPRTAIARLATPAGEALLHAAEADPEFARALLDAISRGRRFPGAGGELAAWSTPALARHAAPVQQEPAPLSAEQSNTSIRFGDAMLLKLFRRVEAGPNPELEVGVFLTTVARFPATPPVLGALEYRPARGEPWSLALLQAFVKNEGDAWSHALSAVEAALGSAAAQDPALAPARAPLLALARSAPPAEARALVGGFLDHAALLGRRTAELHLALASRDAPEAFRPEPFGEADRWALRDEATRLVGDGLRLLAARLGALAPDVRPRAEALLGAREELARRIAAAVDRPIAGLRTRIHGDYHLGQVLFTGSDFVIIDFEGEPARPLAARRAKGSPLRDVAGMVRSLHYAAQQGLAALTAAGDRGGGPPPDRAARAWYVWTAATYLRAYLETARRGRFLPEDEAALGALLDLHLLEKAVYELAYELNNRPAWVGLPLAGIADLLAAGDASGQEEATTAGEGNVARKADERRAPAGGRDGAREAGPAAGAQRADVLHAGGPSPQDLHLWNEGTHSRAYRSMGAHLATIDGVAGTSFAVWAPNARSAAVMGDFNGWDKERHPLRPLGSSGVWQGFVPGVGRGAVYKYHLRARHGGHAVDKADPFGFLHEAPPRTGSIVWDLDHRWGDGAWMSGRAARNGLASPMSIYEVHLGSWRRVPEEGNRPLTYREAAPLLADYAVETGFTHVELLPLTEHPFYGSWGYQTTGYFAPTSRFGTPQDLMFLVDTLHQRGVGVILDWVPSHFPTDEHGLAYFDGTHLFEHADRRQGHHPDWDSFIFNYGRHEVKSFLVSSALFWLDHFHADGLRVDAVASMLYLDYSRKHGEWIPNVHGGRENLEAIAFLRALNETVYREYPDVQTIAEESTSWPMVSRPLYVGGLGFGLKWDMGWMHDTLGYLRHDPIHRRYHHNEITFRMMYAFSENMVLPLSHDEVVHGKGSLLDKMPGDDREQFANLRLLLAYQWAQPGKKLLFMGGELAQRGDWSHERSLDWHLLDAPWHAGVRILVGDLNRLLREPALHARDFDPAGFEWVDANDADASVLSFLRRAGGGAPDLLVVINFTPVVRRNYRVGVPRGGLWSEVLNTDAPLYGGSGVGNLGGVEAAPVSSHGRPHALSLTLPPLAAVFFKGPA